MKKCNGCGVESDNFSPHRASKDGLYPKCRVCAAAIARDRRAKLKKELPPVISEEGLQVCSRCNEPKGETFFYPSAWGQRGKWCKDCRREYGTKWARDGSIDRHLRSRYGITEDERNEMEQQQEGLCAICGDATSLHVDHCHETGKVRALLCGSCNRGLGMFGENPDRLLSAFAYLLEHSVQPSEIV